MDSEPAFSCLFSLYLSNFLSFHNLMKYSSKIFQQPCKVECSSLVCRLMMTCCIVRLRSSLLLIFFPVFVQFSSLPCFEECHFSSKISHEPCRLVLLLFGMHVDDDLLYRGIGNQPDPVYSSLYLSNFLSIHTFKNESFRQRFLTNHAS